MTIGIFWVDEKGIEHPFSELLLIDNLTGALESIETPHHEIHEGHSYVVQEGIQLNNTSKEYLITTPNIAAQVHMEIAVEGGQDTLARFVEGTGKTGGTPMPVVNRNRNSYNKSDVTVAHSPSGVEGTITPLFTCQFGIPAAGGGRGGSGGTLQGRREYVLIPGTKYSLTVTALSANDNNICVVIDWYEHIPKEE